MNKSKKVALITGITGQDGPIEEPFLRMRRGYGSVRGGGVQRQ